MQGNVKEQESILRDLLQSIATAIAASSDVLEHKTVDVQGLSNTRYTPQDKTDLSSRPEAHQLLKTFASSAQKKSMKNIIDQLCAADDLVIWGHAPGYTKENVGQMFLDNYCHALVSGPDGPLQCPSPLGAFVLFGPETLYKDHSHAPNEVYLALTGGGEWRVGNSGWRQLQSGNTIFIPSHTVHAIRTGSEPLLTFSFWLEPGEMEAINI